jgi:type I restriction enzyme M protein
VVPNGIVATTQTAYKQLRKILVEDSLIAVISLPAGCFNPYSGVKTSILLLDKGLAKKADSILFIKISNDGYDLGAQRREIEMNDLPIAFNAFNNYKSYLSDGKAFCAENYADICLLVAKDKVLKNKDIVLNSDRYITNDVIGNQYEVVPMSDFVEFKRGTSITKKDVIDGNIPVIAGGQQPAYFHNINNRDAGTITVSSSGAYAGFVSFHNYPIFASDCFTVASKDKSILSDLFLYYLLKGKQEVIYQMQDGGGQPHIYPKNFDTWEIPLPPLEIQEQIVKEIEGYQKIIDGAKMVVDNYKPTISIKPEWEMVELGTLAKLVGGSTPSKENNEYWEKGNIDWITCSDFSDNPMFIEDSINKITEKAVKESSTHIIPKDTLVLVTRVSLGKMAFVRKPTALNQDLTAIIVDVEKADKKYIYFFLLSIADKIKNDGHGATVKGVTRDYVKDIKVPLPPRGEQIQITKQIESEQQLVLANKQVINIFEQKINNKIDEVWGIEVVAEL